MNGVKGQSKAMMSLFHPCHYAEPFTHGVQLQGTAVKVSIGFPPDTQTPGFDAENKCKPIETQRISEASKPFPADKARTGT